MGYFKMAKTLMSSLFQKQATIQYPLAPKVSDPLVRGHVAITIEDCIFCGMCARKCPTGAITVTKAEKEWAIERFQCVQCSCCADVCPKKCLYMDSGLTAASQSLTRDVVKDARIPADPADHSDR